MFSAAGWPTIHRRMPTGTAGGDPVDLLCDSFLARSRKESEQKDQLAAECPARL
jgi:hypothetical protein